jgi:hypothetical protein
MGAIKSPTPVKFLIAMLVAPDGMDKIDLFDTALEQQFGPIDLKSQNWPFDLTDYYTPEMGPNLTRRFVSFENLIDPDRLAQAKITTNTIEEQLTKQFRNQNSGRIVNLDAGYLTLSQFVLATTKNYSHRLYIGQGIWAEITLRYQKGKYIKWEWTYPDYADGRYNDFLIRVREKLKSQLPPKSIQ